MTIIRRRLILIWAIAVLLIGGAQFEHAIADLFCHTDCPTEQHTDNTDCPVEHTCCHPHVPAFFVSLSEQASPAPTMSTRLFLSRDAMSPEGPSREIDYPPQLS